MQGLNWYWIGLGATVPAVVAVIVAFLFWRTGQTILGNVVGTGVIFSAAFGLIFREYAEVDRILQRCLDAGFTCFPEPSAFTRFSIYACVALLDVFLLFYLSLMFEERRRSRDYAPEWR
ncbi:MAG: hypothetical protein ABIP65_08395 [Vicinamibacterales bacterium]